MTAAPTKIFELFLTLSQDEQRTLLAQLTDTVEDGVEDLRAEEIAAIEEGLAQMKRGETIGSDELFAAFCKNETSTGT